MATGKLKDDETRLARYDDLSRGKKQEMDIARRKELDAAKKDENVPLSNRAVDAMTQLHPLLPQKWKDESAKRIGDDAQRRKQRVEDAEKQPDRERTLYADDVPHKLGKGLGLKAGGKVSTPRGWGIARKLKK